MNIKTIEARERAALANEAWAELASVLEIMKEMDRSQHQAAIRGMAMRCSDLIDVMGLALEPEMMKAEEAWEVLYGRGHEALRAEYVRRAEEQAAPSAEEAA